MIEFHYCKEFKEKIEREKYKEEIYKRIDEHSVRNELKSANIDAFASSLYVLKISNPRTRVIIEKRNIFINKEEEKEVFFIRDIVLNKNFDRIYGRSIFHKLKSGEWLRSNPLQKDDIEIFKQEYTNNINTKNLVTLNPPPTNLTEWFNDFKLELNNEIFETEQWVRYALSKSALDGMEDNFVQIFRTLLKKIIEDKELDDSKIIKSEKNIDIRLYIDNNVGIIYSKIKIEKQNIVVLYNGARILAQKEYWNQAIENIKNSDIEFEVDKEVISRKSFRSYPKWTVSDENLWFAIEKSKEISNLSLTKEQVDFLTKFKFPYYINGQAGSGKSTMLYYLFANIYFLKVMDSIKGNLIFLTENEKLLEDTKRYVFDLLNYNPEFNGISHEEKENSQQYFNSFKNFLLEILNEEEKILFKKDKYLNFSIFKELYENSTLATHIINRYSAEEAWFVIITYIYGNDINKKVTSDNYLSLIESKSQTITLETFVGIEKNILPFYDNLIKNGYWDKLKIIRYISNNINMNLKKKYSVVICDEAQDFCKVELDFILKLSEYLNYDLSYTEQMPVVFAGDPNQTVNPTGFRQDEMTGMLYRELEKVNFRNKSDNKYNPSLNYRSSHPVVSLANFVQYYRIKELGIKQDKPQEAKRPISNKDIEFNIFLNYDTIEEDRKLKKDLIKKLEHKIFIVPVDSQTKDSFIDNSILLSQIKSKEVKTSVEAKGAEYSHVVLYGFGEYFLKKFGDLKDDIKNNNKFIIGYFFNKLYVGLTRAQTELIIIDSKESEELFWKKLVDKSKISKNNDEWKILKESKSITIEYNPGAIGHMILDSTKEDALSNAQEDKKQGIYHNNPARLRVASSQFLRLGKKDEFNECLALAEEIMNNYKEASTYYLKSDKLEEASICLFKGQFFEELWNIKLKTVEHDLRKIIYRVMEEEKIIQKDIEILSENKDTLNKLIKDLDWREKLLFKFILLSKENLEIEFKRELVEILKSIAISTDKKLWNTIAQIYYSLENYKKAINAWEKMDLYKDNKYYCEAKLKFAREVNDIESILIWLDKVSSFEEEQKRKNTFKEIIEIFETETLNENSSEYYLTYYKACLVLKKDEKIEVASKLAEEESTSFQLIFFYQNLLEIFYLNKKITIFIIERWAKAIYKEKYISIEELNNKYLEFSKKYHIKYKKFTDKELEKISDIPEPPKWTPPKHLQKIKIKNFRHFNEIVLEDIGQFNLIVGDNNVGKTSILEALLFSSQKKLYFKNLAFAYIERKNIFPIKKDGEENIYDIPNNFVNDFINRTVSPRNIEFELEEHRNTWSFQIHIPEKDEVRKQLNIDHTIENTDYISLSIDNDSNVVDIPLLLKKISSTDSIKTRLIPFGKGFDKNLVKVYADNIDKNRIMRNAFLESMQIFIPNIDRITTDTESGEVYIEETTSDKASPLHQYGEGAKKLFRILVQITLQKDGKLLVDEIDAGIHYSHFFDFWKVVLQVAKENNVQIFATTHNIECVEYFKEVLEEELIEYQNLSRVISLQKLSESTTKAYTHTFKEFEYELDNEFEIRGGDL